MNKSSTRRSACRCKRQNSLIRSPRRRHWISLAAFTDCDPHGQKKYSSLLILPKKEKPIPTNCRGDNGSAWLSGSRCSTTPGYFCSTSLPQALIREHAEKSGKSWRNSRG